MTGVEQPPHNNPDSLGDDLDQEWAALSINQKHGDLLTNNTMARLDYLLQKYEISTILRLSDTSEDQSRKREEVYQWCRQLAYNSELPDEEQDKLYKALLWTYTDQMNSEVTVLTLAFAEIGLQTGNSKNPNSSTMDSLKKKDMITTCLRLLGEEPDSSWFSFLNEAFGGGDIFPEQVEQAIEDRIAIEKVKGVCAESQELLDLVFMETGGMVSGIDAIATAKVVMSLACISNGSDGEYEYRVAESAKILGLSKDQIKNLVTEYIGMRNG